MLWDLNTTQPSWYEEIWRIMIIFRNPRHFGAAYQGYSKRISPDHDDPTDASHFREHGRASRLRSTIERVFLKNEIARHPAKAEAGCQGKGIIKKKCSCGVEGMVNDDGKDGDLIFPY